MRNPPRIAGDDHDPRLDALIRMEIACQLALESLPRLSPEAGNRLREPIKVLCDVTRTELDQLQPGWNARSAPRFTADS
jgi:hypothetical protein